MTLARPVHEKILDPLLPIAPQEGRERHRLCPNTRKRDAVHDQGGTRAGLIGIVRASDLELRKGILGRHVPRRRPHCRHRLVDVLENALLRKGRHRGDGSGRRRLSGEQGVEGVRGFIPQDVPMMLGLSSPSRVPRTKVDFLPGRVQGRAAGERQHISLSGIAGIRNKP